MPHMNPMNDDPLSGPADAEAAWVEALLIEARAFEPERPAPDDLAMRALVRAGLLTPDGRPAAPPSQLRRWCDGLTAATVRPFALRGALAAALATALLVFLAPPPSLETVSPPQTETIPLRRGVSAPMTPTPSIAGQPQEHPGGTVPSLTGLLTPAVEAAAGAARPAAFAPSYSSVAYAASLPPSSRRRPRRAGFQRPGRFTAAAAKFGASTRRPRYYRAAVAPAPPHARWETQTVVRESRRVLAPGWIIEHADTQDGVVLAATPVVLDLSISGEDGGDMPALLLPPDVPDEENSVLPPSSSVHP